MVRIYCELDDYIGLMKLNFIFKVDSNQYIRNSKGI